MLRPHPKALNGSTSVWFKHEACAFDAYWFVSCQVTLKDGYLLCVVVGIGRALCHQHISGNQLTKLALLACSLNGTAGQQ
jgi:hypothetical protein